MQANNAKSVVFVTGSGSNIKQAILDGLNFQEGVLPVRYPGVPLISSRLSESNCAPIIDKLKQRIMAWTSKYLSFAGRLLLINSVLFHLQRYWASTFVLPSSICVSINQICRNFLWSGKWDVKGIPVVSWRDVCLPRNEGGLGIKQIKMWNYVAMGKLLWKLQANTQDIWVKWIKYQLKGNCFWTIAIPHDVAWLWRKLLRIRHFFRDNMSMRLGDGRQIYLFYDIWCGDKCLTDIIDVSSWRNELNVEQWIRNGV